MAENKDKVNKYDIFISSSTYPDAESLFIIPKSIKEIKDECYVVLDTNSLLVPYATSTESLKQIQSTYTTLVTQNRLRIPGQVAREFANNRAKKLVDLYQQLSQKQNSIQLPKEGEKYPLLESLSYYQELIQAERELQEKAKQYRKVVKKLLEHIEGWNWNDPVTKIYSELFSKDVVIDLELNEEEKKEIENQLDKQKIHNLPPAYKDYSKDDKGIGDLLIWRTILYIGRNYKKSVIFVSGEEKPDWWHRSNNKALYPRYELVDEFRRCSEGETFHIIQLSNLLKMYGADENVVKEIEIEEEQSKQQIHITGASSYFTRQEIETAIFIWLNSRFKLVERLDDSDIGSDLSSKYSFIVSNSSDNNLKSVIYTYVSVQIQGLGSLQSIRSPLTVLGVYNRINKNPKIFIIVYLDLGTAKIGKSFSDSISLPENTSLVIGYLKEDKSFQEI